MNPTTLQPHTALSQIRSRFRLAVATLFVALLLVALMPRTAVAGDHSAATAGGACTLTAGDASILDRVARASGHSYDAVLADTLLGDSRHYQVATPPKKRATTSVILL